MGQFIQENTGPVLRVEAPHTCYDLLRFTYFAFLKQFLSSRFSH